MIGSRVGANCGSVTISVSGASSGSGAEPLFSSNDPRISVLQEPIPDSEPVPDQEPVPGPEPVLDPEQDPEPNLGPLFSAIDLRIPVLTKIL
jgi:hypothetical protein